LALRNSRFTFASGSRIALSGNARDENDQEEAENNKVNKTVHFLFNCFFYKFIFDN
jgi:hypothetical protein